MSRARGDARHTSADVSKAKNILGYNPQVALKAGLTKEWEWIKSQQTSIKSNIIGIRSRN